MTCVATDATEVPTCKSGLATDLLANVAAHLAANITASTQQDVPLKVAVLREQVFNSRRPAPGRTNYAESPRLPRLDAGEDLFRRRCQACHTVWAGDATGPDLLGVTGKRDRAWLARWIKEPDRMLAEKGPLALALYADYRELPMPNLRLSDREVDSRIEYLEAESLRMGRSARTGRGSGTAPVHR